MMRRFIIILCVLCGVSVKAQEPLSSNKQLHKTAGDILVGALPALALGSTFIWKDGQQGTMQFTKTLASTIAVTYALKFAVKKERPNGENFNSFPSGHISIAFSSAAFMQKRYGWKVGVPAYALASYVGYSRIKANKHDGWDVLAGAVIGTGIGYLFTKTFKPNDKFNVTLGSFDNYTTVGFTYQF